MLRFFLCVVALWAFASPALVSAQNGTTISLESSGRELRVPMDAGYVRVSTADTEYFEFFIKLMNRGKLVLIEVLVTAEDLEQVSQGNNPSGMIYKIATDPLFGTEVVDKNTWSQTLPAYRASMASVDTKKVDALVQEKFDDAINEQLPENIVYDTGNISQPKVYRSESHGFRLQSTVPFELTVDDKIQKELYLVFGAVVNLQGRVFLISAEVIAPKSEEDYERRRNEFDRFIDKVIALNGGEMRG